MSGTSGPKLLRELGDGWSIRRWEYDAAPVELHGPKGVVLEFTPGRDHVELSVEYETYGTFSTYQDTLNREIPLAHLRELLGWGEEEPK